MNKISKNKDIQTPYNTTPSSKSQFSPQKSLEFPLGISLLQKLNEVVDTAPDSDHRDYQDADALQPPEIEKGRNIRQNQKGEHGYKQDREGCQVPGLFIFFWPHYSQNNRQIGNCGQEPNQPHMKNLCELANGKYYKSPPKQVPQENSHSLSSSSGLKFLKF